MPDMIYKTFRAEVKSVDSDEGTIDMIIPVSTASVDRDGEIVEPYAFKKTLPKFMKRPVLVSSHDYRDLTSQIGEWTKLKITENGVEGKPKYYINEGNEQADWGFKLASKGMAAFSIGFIPTKWQDGDGQKTPRRTYLEVELLEISQVIVPSNREAIQSIRSKGIDPVANKLFDDILADKELITKSEETENYYRIPVPGEAGKHDDHKIRTMDVSKEKGIKGLYCIEDKKIITYMFDKDKWESMSECRDWMKEHMDKYLVAETTNSMNTEVTLSVVKIPDTIQIYKKTSQESIRDELDYVDKLITQVGLSKETAFDAVDVAIRTMARAWPYHQWESITLGENLTGENEPIIFKRISGSDIPVKINIATNPATSKENLQVQDILESLKRIGGK